MEPGGLAGLWQGHMNQMWAFTQHLQYCSCRWHQSPQQQLHTCRYCRPCTPAQGDGSLVHARVKCLTAQPSLWHYPILLGDASESCMYLRRSADFPCTLTYVYALIDMSCATTSSPYFQGSAAGMTAGMTLIIPAPFRSNLPPPPVIG